jgi:hypothetical protein
MTDEDVFHFSKTSMFEHFLPPFCWILLSNIHHSQVRDYGTRFGTWARFLP